MYSHVEKLIGPSGHTFTSMRSMLKEARRHFGARGSIFNLQRVRDAEDEWCRGVLLDALEQDNRMVPERLREQLDVKHLFDEWTVQYAVDGGEQMASKQQQSGG